MPAHADATMAEEHARTAPAGLVHGFGRRSGGPGPETREETRARVAAELRPHGRLLLLHQVHGAVVREAPWDGRVEADAAVAGVPGLLLGIETADCLPVLLFDPVRRAVGAAHAGWRGTAAGVGARAVEALVAAGSRPADIVAALGPCIGACCYEVGDEVKAALGPAASASFRPGPRGRDHLDLRAENRRQLVEAGLDPGRVTESADCTSCRADLYHSHRRDGAGSGRMISYVGFAAAG
jgi:YfiH family protein